MKKLLSIILALALSLAAFGQTTADVLAALPAQNSLDFNAQMAILANATSVQEVASSLVPADKGQNNRAEYALSGVVRFVTAPGNASLKAGVREGLLKAASACSDPVNKAFLINLLRYVATEADTQVLQNYAAKGRFDLGTLGLAPQLSKDLSLKEAKALLKSHDSHLATQGALAVMKIQGSKVGLKLLSGALAGTDKPYRNAVLSEATKLYGVAPVEQLIRKSYFSLSADAKEDVLNWAGNQRVTAAIDLVIAEFETSAPLPATAMTAASKIGGSKASAALIEALGGENSAVALAALKCFKADLTDKVEAALGKPSNDIQEAGLLALASAKHMKALTPKAIEMAGTGNKAALGALAGLVGAKDFRTIASMLDAAPWECVEPLQAALEASVRSLSAQEKYDMLSLLDNRNPVRFYKALAHTDLDEAVGDLVKAGPEAFEALLLIDNAKAAPALLAAVEADSKVAAQALPRYVSLVEKYEDSECARLCAYSKALSLSQDDATRSTVLLKVKTIPMKEAFALAAPYLEGEGTAYAASKAVKSIASKVAPSIDKAELQSALGKAIAVFSSTGDPDDGYDVDAIKKILAEN